MIFFKLGIRNLGRNKRRSFLSGLAIGIGLASLIIADGFWLGMMNNMVRSVTNTFLGHAQVHNQSFKLSREVGYDFDPSDVIKKIKRNNQIKVYTSRILAQGMVNSAQDTSNIQIVGIDPEREKEISLFDERILEGNYLSSIQDIMLGQRLVKKLQVSIGERVVLTTTDVTGSLSQHLFRLSGVYGTGTQSLDEYMVIIHHDKARQMLSIKPNHVHELAIKFHNLNAVDKNDLWLRGISSEHISVDTWRDLAPQIVAALNMYNISISIIASILLSLVSLGILNTMFMSLYERVFEFGVFRALGTRSSEIIKMIISEAMALALLSIFIGCIISFVVGGLMSIYGIDYAGIEFAEITFTEKIFFEFRWQQYVYFPLLIFVFTILVSLYPSIHVIRMSMSKALQKSL